MAKPYCHKIRVHSSAIKLATSVANNLAMDANLTSRCPVSYPLRRDKPGHRQPRRTHFRNFVRDRLEVGNWASKLFSFVGIFNRRIQRGLSQPQCQRPVITRIWHRIPPKFLKPVPCLPSKLPNWNLNFIQNQFRCFRGAHAQLVDFAPTLTPRIPFLD